MIIIYIHGAGASKDSFNYIREHLSSYKDTFFEYNTQDGFKRNLEIMSAKMKRHSNIFFVAHSMGGIYALHLANLYPNKVLGAVTMGTPYGGVEAADYAKYFFPFYRLIKDIGTTSIPVKSANDIDVLHPWTQIVSTNGTSPWISQPNDGVVTVSSQRHHQGMEFIEMPLNHYEIVISPKVVKIIENNIKQLSS